MINFAGIDIENAASMTEIERLQAAFEHITNQATKNLQAELEAAKAAGDADNIKLYHVQIGMFRHSQAIFKSAKQYAQHPNWNNDASNA